MSFLGRLFGRGSSGSVAKAIALFETEDYVATAEILRDLSAQGAGGPGSLIDFHLRQALLRQGKALLSDGNARAAIPWFAEVTSRWPAFPDLQFWHGLALGHAGQWSETLQTAHQALHHNTDYIEARVLEAAALLALDDAPRAAESLNQLVDSGQRVEHHLIRLLATKAPYTSGTVPPNLLNLLHGTVCGGGGRKAILEAVQHCRQGFWDEGIARIRELCQENPTYPDFRVKLAAALFQTRDNSGALAEIEQALILNPRYRTAAHLKALILADQHRFNDALSVIDVQQAVTDPVVGHPGEELFCSYLDAALSLLTGRLTRARTQLDRWQNLESTFPTAELLRAAVADLGGDDESCLRRLQGLAEMWDQDANFSHHLCRKLLQLRRLDALETQLAKWPADQGAAAVTSEHHRFLTAMLHLSRRSLLPADAVPKAASAQPAWRVLAARDLALQERWLESLNILRDLGAEDETSERVAQLALRCYVEIEDTEAVPSPRAQPDAVLQHWLCLLHRQERTEQALSIVHRHQELHPDDLRWTWLDPTFWLTPIRDWIG